MISFNKPPYTGFEEEHVLAAMRSIKISGDGHYTRKCQSWFEEHLPSKKTLFTPSCTAALEMSAMLIGIQPGDEVIMPSYTFVSTANAFALRGAKLVFVDIRPDTLNIDEALVEAAITSNTKAIVPVHYAGVACEMDSIMDTAERYGLYVIEDAAQGVKSSYKGRSLGSIGHLGTFSFHETKNYTSGGEGGLLVINEENFIEHAEIIREKGTNRCQFFRGEVDKYSWVDLGSSYLPSELQAAYLWAQLEHADEITKARLKAWDIYYKGLYQLMEAGHIELAAHPEGCIHNGHMFYLKTADLDERIRLLYHLKENEVMAIFHYVPLHNSRAGKVFGRFSGRDIHTTRESERLVRLPIWYGISETEQRHVINAVKEFFE